MNVTHYFFFKLKLDFLKLALVYRFSLRIYFCCRSMLVTKTDGLSNPTPAMLKVMERSKRRTSEQSSKRSRGDRLVS